MSNSERGCGDAALQFFFLVKYSYHQWLSDIELIHVSVFFFSFFISGLSLVSLLGLTLVSMLKSDSGHGTVARLAVIGKRPSSHLLSRRESCVRLWDLLLLRILFPFLSLSSFAVQRRTAAMSVPVSPVRSTLKMIENMHLHHRRPLDSQVRAVNVLLQATYNAAAQSLGSHATLYTTYTPFAFFHAKTHLICSLVHQRSRKDVYLLLLLNAAPLSHVAIFWHAWSITPLSPRGQRQPMQSWKV